MADGEVEAEEPQAGLIKGKERRNVIERMRMYSYSLPYMRTEPVCGISLKRLNEQGQKKKRLTVKSMHRYQRNILSLATITKVNGIF